MLALLGTLCLATPGVAQDSLADQARQARKSKPTSQTRSFDNDNLPREDKLSIVGTAQPAADASSAPAAAAPSTAAPSNSAPNNNDPATNPAGSNEFAKAPARPGAKDNNVVPKDDGSTKKPAETAATPEKSDAAKKQAEWQQWKDRIVAQKDSIDLAQRELDVTEREYKLRAAAMYADVGNRLRNETQWDKEDADYKAQIEAKKKAVADGSQKLEELQEQARKAGVPASMREP